MNRLFRIVLAAGLLSVPLLAQNKTPRLDQIAARVNGDIILSSEINRELENRRQDMVQHGAKPAEVERDMAEAKEVVVRDLIDRALLMQVAKEAGLNADIDVLQTMEKLQKDQNYATMQDLERAIIRDYGDLEEFKNDIRAKYLTQRVIDHEVYSHIIITTEEEKKFYDEHQKDFDKPAGVRLSQIVVLVDRRLPDQVATQRKKIEDAQAALKKGDAFEDVAKKYSEDSTAEDGGDADFHPFDELNEDVTKAIKDLEKNKMTDILEASDAFVIYKVTDRHNGGVLSFDLARKYIWPELMGKVAPPKVREFLSKLRETGFVDVKEGFTDVGAIPKLPKPKATASSK